MRKITASTNEVIQLNPSHWGKPGVKVFGFLKGMTKLIFGLVEGATPGQQANGWFQLSSGSLEILESCGFQRKEGQIGWELVSRSLLGAFYSLIAETRHQLDIKTNFMTKNRHQLFILNKQLNSIFKTNSYYLCPDFFTHPEKLPLLEVVSKENGVLDDYLKLFDYDLAQRQSILRRLKTYFVFALVEEWRTNSALYGRLTEKLDTPFTDAQNKAFQWMHYRQSLIQEIHRPVFEDTFDLSDVYIPLRACYEVKKSGERAKVERSEDQSQVIDIDRYLDDWLKKEEKEDCIKMISGGPGFGKSSSLKMLAARLAERDENVLFIPLHRFRWEKKLKESIATFLGYDGRITSFNPVGEKDPLILIFDGLDELDSYDKTTADEAQQFVEEVSREIDNYNYTDVRIKAIISGREVIAQRNKTGFRKEGQVLKLLPYLIGDDIKKNCEDPDQLLAVDQRQEWWQTYGRLKGKDYRGLPRVLKKEELDEITAQPLLNYLVALSFEGGGISFTQTLNLNEIYADLLAKVFDRSHPSGRRKHKTVALLEKSEFERLLKKIAVSAWHGNSRKTSIEEIDAHLEASDRAILSKLRDKDTPNKIFSLLLAFYFRQAGQPEDSPSSFEFTHKSFGEYLLAKHIAEEAGRICEQLTKKEKDPDSNDGFNKKEGLTQWIKLFGQKVLDMDIVRFLPNEIAAFPPNRLKEMQQRIDALISYELKAGLPVENLGIATYKEANQYAVNAEKALFVIRSILATQTGEVSRIEWPSPVDFGNLLRRLIEQRGFSLDSSFMCRFLNHLDASGSFLFLQDLHHAALNHTNLSEADLSEANLSEANLIEADLREADLCRADLYGADLNGANLNGANLYEANLYNADLIGANLSGANLSEVDLSEANLSRADLSGADLIGANLSEANLSEADLRGADLRGADLREADLNNTNLRGADLYEARIEKEDLTRADIAESWWHKQGGIIEEDYDRQALREL